MNRHRQISILLMVILLFLVPLSSWAQLTTPLPGSNGTTTTSLGQGSLVTAFGQIATTTASQPGALANFGYTQNGILTTEAGVASSAPTTTARLFVDYSTANGTDSGVAVVNPSSNTITINVQLNNTQGNVTSCPNQTVPANAHLAMFASQLCQGVIPNPFLGTLTLTSTTAFAAANLMAGTNSHGEPLFNSLPVAIPNSPPAGSHLYFSQFADGGGFSTEILLMNLTGTAISGTVTFLDNSGHAVTLNFGPPIGSTSTLNYSIPGNGMQKFTTTGSTLGTLLQVGAVVVTSTAGSLPSGAVVFSSYNGKGGLASQAGVLNSPLTTYARLYVEKSNSPLTRNTGVAIVNPNNSVATVQLNLVSLDGSFTIANTITLQANNHMAAFIDQSALMGASAASIPPNFQGVLTLSSNQPIAPVTLRLTTNQRGENLYSTLPVVDLNNPPAGPLYLPQIADGGGFTTQIILINTSNNPGNITVNFFNDNGSSVQIPFTSAPMLTLQSFTLSATSVAGGGSITGTVTLSGVAPAGGAQVGLSSNNSSAHVPATVSIAAGQSIATFTVTTTAVTSTETATITAALGTVQKIVTLTVTPPSPPQWQTADIFGTVTLDGKTINIEINNLSPSPSFPLAAVTNYGGDVSSLIVVALVFDQQISINGNTVTFSHLNPAGSSYANLNISPVILPVMSGTLTLTIISPTVGAPVSGQLQFTTIDGTPRQSDITGTILSIVN